MPKQAANRFPASFEANVTKWGDSGAARPLLHGHEEEMERTGEVVQEYE
jgi:hypothetical protein